MALTGRAALVAAALVPLVALTASWTAVLVVALAVLAAGAVDLALAGSVRTLRLHRTGDQAVRLGETAQITVAVQNLGDRRVRGLLRDAWSPSAGLARSRFRVDLPPGEVVRLTERLRPTRRGDRRADRVTVRSVGPLGLAARQGSHAVPWTLRALPPFGSRKHLPSRLARLRDLDGRTPVLLRGQGSEFDSLREYVIGDDVRSIDWRATARTADVVVRTWRPERDRHLLLVLDAARTAAGRVGDAPRLDAAMDAALLLAALASRAGDRVDLLVHDRVVRAAVLGRPAADLLPSMVSVLAPVEAQLVEPDWGSIAAEILRRSRRRSLVVLLTGLDPAPVEHGLLPVLPRLTARHQVVLAAVADPRVDELAGARGDAAAVYTAAAAERTRLDRARVTARLGRLGVDVVEGRPEELPPKLADSYLALKAAGRL